MYEISSQPQPTHEMHRQHATDSKPIISEAWKWATVCGNAVIAAGELISGNLTTLSVTSDGIHNLGDVATYYMQADNILNPRGNDARRARLRTIAYWTISLTSLGMSAKAGLDWTMDQENTPHDATLYAAAASLGLNGLLFARLRKGIRRSRGTHSNAQDSIYEHDLSKHFWAVDLPSAALAVIGAGLQHYHVDIEQGAAVASGLFGTYAFRPTKSNMAHASHGHGHGAVAPYDVGHTPKHRTVKGTKPTKNWLAGITYRAQHTK